jgi:hypothetical protein
VQAGQGLGQAFVVAGEAAEAGHTRIGAFDAPALGKQDEAAPGLRELDDLQADAPGGGSLGRGCAGVALAARHA